jgi:predicted ATPase
VSPTALVIVLEDLRWADGDTGELVKYLADNVSGLPVLLVLTLR